MIEIQVNSGNKRTPGHDPKTKEQKMDNLKNKAATKETPKDEKLQRSDDEVAQVAGGAGSYRAKK